jgi:hypothetical protein
VEHWLDQFFSRLTSPLGEIEKKMDNYHDRQSEIENVRFGTVIDLMISSEVPRTTASETLSYLGSDHLPVLTHFHHLQSYERKLSIPRTDWAMYTSILETSHDQVRDELQETIPNSEKTFQWFITLEQVLNGLRLRVTE